MKFSIIVPVYGVERYLDECMRSILSQTYTDFEVILVDDKSPDNCPAMCDEYAKTDSRVRVIHKEKNEGPANARNTGLSVAKGEYIVFVDSDDCVSSDMLSAYEGFVEDGVDVFACGMEMFFESAKGKRLKSTVLQPNEYYAETPKDKAKAFSILTQSRVFPYVWNKAYRREMLLVCGAGFENTKLMEDFLFNIAVFNSIKSVRIGQCAFYQYRKPPHETLTSKYFPDFFEASKRKYQKEKEFLRLCESEEVYKQDIVEGYLKHLISAVIRNKSKKAALSKKRQKELLYSMMTDETTVEALSNFQPRSAVYRLIKKLIEKKQVRRLYCLCSMIKMLRFG